MIIIGVISIISTETIRRKAHEKTTCCDYTELDKEISEDFRESIRKCVERLAPSDRKDLNNQISYLLGERFHVKESTIVKILSRMMVDGDTRENKEMVAMALKIQVKQRMKLLDELLENKKSCLIIWEKDKL